MCMTFSMHRNLLCTLYLDTYGDALFKQNLQKLSREPPLRENLATDILQLAGWQPSIPLLDPMCGSGTFLLEAVQMLLNIAPRTGPSFAFEKLNKFDDVLWNKLKRESVVRQRAKLPQLIYGSDLYGNALVDAHTNLSMVGFANVVVLKKQGNILKISTPASTSILITNLPYDKHVGEQKELAELYPKLGDVLKKKFIGWNAYFFTSNTLLPKLIRLTASRRIRLFNAALECRLLEYKMVTEGMRRINKVEITQRSNPTSTASHNL